MFSLIRRIDPLPTYWARLCALVSSKELLIRKNARVEFSSLLAVSCLLTCSVHFIPRHLPFHVHEVWRSAIRVGG